MLNKLKSAFQYSVIQSDSCCRQNNIIINSIKTGISKKDLGRKNNPGIFLLEISRECELYYYSKNKNFHSDERLM